ncbi:hypothetical protein FY534_12825 [Alicyclobacillus sp. TC]|uniref:Septal ring factor EnvC (AmiA/AmiB activator) n=1 Tax=Alicyclobacillus tolerans TaxID=90970 RepID=A0ABT9LTZ2_9BACL|nr:MULTISPECIES: hypothetical protein [Alicyclobacillus]MDP9727727.1 septal ring factor EnvC (AmiA/AmiB activator) [Alicyclobacillus tengchongensis]QRF24412.1 hypothetical protein FY534_12825 [Alicyclobacillus sp. TC]
MKTWLAGSGTVAILAVLGVMLPTTVQLTRLNLGLNSSLRSTQQLVIAEQEIVTKNKSLPLLVQTAEKMTQRIEATVTETGAIHDNIVRINQLNSDVLAMNQAMMSPTGESAATLAKVNANLLAITEAAQQMQQSVASLDQVLGQDASNLSQIETATQTMNQKVPEVSP